jgi:hypothetical protein
VPSKTNDMNYTPKQIENAKRNYNAMLVIRTVESYDPYIVGWAAAQQRCEWHNNKVGAILAGDKALEREWKLFFLTEEVRADQKAEKNKAKLSANKEASSDVLAQIKSAGKLLKDYYAFVKSNKQFAREFFSKKFTQESVNAFLTK